MSTHELEEKLKEKFDVNLIFKFNYQNETYVQALKDLGIGVEYIYYKIEEENIEQVIKEELLNKFKQIYDIKKSDIIY